MTYLKKYGIRTLISMLGILASIVILTVFYYFNLVNDTVFSFLELIAIIMNIFCNSYILGKDSIKNGYLEGVKFGGIILFILTLVTLLLRAFKFKIIIYYFIIFITAILGSMVGISRKKD